jgi:hypothetical protein
MASSRRRKNKKLHQRRRKKRAATGPRRASGQTQPAVIRQTPLPSELDQIGVFIAEPELGLAATTLTQLRKLAESLPFEAAMLEVGILIARVHPVMNKPAGQWQLAQQFYASRPDLLERYREVLHEEPQRLVFSPQPLTLLLRMLIDHAKQDPLRNLDSVEFGILQDAVLGAHSAIETALDQLGLPSRDHLLAYELQAATFFRRPQLLEEMARHQELLRLATADERFKGSHNRVPVEDWLAASGMSAAKQWAVGFGLSAITESFGDTVRPRALAEHVDDLLNRFGLGATSRELPVLAASRSEFQAEFASLGGGEETLAWEVRPFKSRPFLRFADGDLLLLSPSWLLSWLGEGFHYRAMTHAQQVHGSSVSAKYTRFMGEIVERYAVDLAETAVTPLARVVGEQPYGKGDGQRTSDVVIHVGADLILFEVHARRVAAIAAVTGSVADATLEVSRLLVDKIEQVGLCIAALLAGDATLPKIEIDTIERIWPVVVSVGHVMQTQNLWGYLNEAMDKAKTASLAEPRVQPLQVMDMADYEKLMGLLQAGEDLPALLARKTSGPFRERDLAAWLHGDRAAPSDKPRLSILEERWEAMSDEVIRLGKLAASALEDDSTRPRQAET